MAPPAADIGESRSRLPSILLVKKDSPQLVWLAILLWNLAIGLDCTSLATALPTVATELAATANETFWTGTAFLVASAALQPFFTAVANAVGRKVVTLLSLVFFAIGALVCALAHNVAALLFGRTIQGIGAGGLLALTYILMTDLTAIEDRAKKMSYLGMMWTVSTCGGPVLGGAVTQSATWRWVFWINLPICFVCSLLVCVGLTGNFAGLKRACHSLGKVDWFGSVTFTVSLTFSLVALSWGGTLYNWTSPATLLPLLIGIVGLVGWGFYEVHVPAVPMVPIYPIMKYRTAVVNYMATVIMGIAMYAMIYFLPLYFQVVKQYSPIYGGLGLLPIAATAGPCAALFGQLMDWKGSVKPFNIVAWCVFSVGLALFTMLKPETTKWQWILLLMPSGMGLGMLFVPLSLATQNCIENNPELAARHSKEEFSRLAGSAAGLNPFFRSIGQAVGITIAQTSFSNELKRRTGAAAGDAVSFVSNLGEIMVDGRQPTPDQAAILFTDSLRPTWWIVFALACAMILPVSFLTKENGKKKAAPAPPADIELADLTARSVPQEESRPPAESRHARTGSTSGTSHGLTGFTTTDELHARSGLGGAEA